MGLLKATVLVAVLISCMSAVPSATAGDTPQVAFLGFQLINTSLEPTSPAEDQRIRVTLRDDRDRLAWRGRTGSGAPPRMISAL